MITFVTFLIAGFSNDNHGGKNDKMNNDLSKAVIQATKVLNPSFVVFENVPGLMRKIRRHYLSFILNGLLGLKYSIRMKLLWASDYGVPQRRQRLFIIASRTGVLPPWPETRDSVTVRQAIGDLEFENHRLGGDVSLYLNEPPEPHSYAAEMRGRVEKQFIYNHDPARAGTPTNGSRRNLDWNSYSRTVLASKQSRDSCLHPG